MSSVNYIKRVYRNPVWRCTCGASSFKPKHKQCCPIVLRIKEEQKDREKVAKTHNPKKYISRTWNQVCGIEVRVSSMQPIPRQVEADATLKDKTKIKNKTIEIREAWHDDIKPVWGMEFASSQGKDIKEYLDDTCEPNETVVQATDERWLRIDSELLAQWPTDEAGRIIPPPCMSYWEPKDPCTGFKTGKFIVQKGCLNYDNCPFNHEPLPLPIQEHEQPDKPEIMYGVQMVARMTLDEYVINGSLRTVGEGEFYMTFNEGSTEEEKPIDAFSTWMTGIPVDEIPENEVMLSEREEWKLDAAVAQDTLGVISGAYREALRHSTLVAEETEFHKRLEAAASSSSEDEIFDPVEECIADQMWQERHNELNGGRVKAIAKGRDKNTSRDTHEHPSNAYSWLRRPWMCSYYASRGLRNSKAKGSFSITRRSIRALTFHIKSSNVTRKDLIILRHHIRRCARMDREQLYYLETYTYPFRVEKKEEWIKFGISDKRHKLNSVYKEFIDTAKKRWHEVPKR